MDQISASEKAVFEVGTGDVSILNGQFPKVSIEAGVGDAVFSGSVSNKLKWRQEPAMSMSLLPEQRKAMHLICLPDLEKSG